MPEGADVSGDGAETDGEAEIETETETATEGGPGVSGQVDGTGTPEVIPDPGTSPPVQAGGWSDFKALLVESDGTHALGTLGSQGITGRDTGSKIVFFDVTSGDNASAEVYYWDGEQIVDSSGSPTNDADVAYGDDPFTPNLAAVKAFHDLHATNDTRLFVNRYDSGQLAGGYPDWFMFRRGQTHTHFTHKFEGGRSAAEPMLVGAYGPPGDGRAIIDADTSGGGTQPLQSSRQSATGEFSHHVVLTGLDVVGGWRAQSFNDAGVLTASGEPPSAFVEDCAFTKGAGNRIVYTPVVTTIRRSVIAFSYDAGNHNQGYYTQGATAQTTFDHVVFYKNGYKDDPRFNADPRRDIFSRNVYQGGGARMGFTYRGVISADGASGGPQMRFGGLMENSLIAEGYWFSATNSNSPNNPWPTLQQGSSAIVRNNVQLLFAYPTPADPDPAGLSSTIAQPGAGYLISGASFGATVEHNIISGAMLLDDLGANKGNEGLQVAPSHDTFPDNNVYTFKDISVTDNMLFDVGTGLLVGDNWAGVSGVEVSDNVFVTPQPVQTRSLSGLTGTAQLNVHDNRFYSSGSLPGQPWVGTGNTVSAANAQATEGWSDPRRTLKRYVTEVLGLELLDWGDDPYLDPTQVAARNGEAYDPTGLKTFMAMAVSMRYGGTESIPSSGKPEIDADYAWDVRLTAPVVVNWIREGFGWPAVP